MNTFLSARPYARKQILFLFLPLLFLVLFLFSACKPKVDYFDYVSELRSNVLLAKDEEFSLRIYATAKESPYAADGVARPKQERLEAHLLAPEGTKTTTINFCVDDKDYGGEMSYDNVKGEYFFACNLDASSLKKLDCKIVYGERELSLLATSIRTEKVLSPKNALAALRKEYDEPFASLTDQYGFSGEIYVRLLHEATPYYYIGIIDREGNIHAFLMNAETGKILARREGA